MPLNELYQNLEADYLVFPCEADVDTRLFMLEDLKNSWLNATSPMTFWETVYEALFTGIPALGPLPQVWPCLCNYVGDWEVPTSDEASDGYIAYQEVLICRRINDFKCMEYLETVLAYLVYLYKNREIIDAIND